MKNLFYGIIALIALTTLVACGGSAVADEVTEPIQEAAYLLEEESGLEFIYITTQPMRATQQPSDESDEIALIQSGWVVAPSRDGYWVYYGFILQNPRNDFAMRTPRIRITARSADGSVLGTRDRTLGAMHPNQSFADGGFISTDERPEIVEFEILPARDRDWVNPTSLRLPEYLPLYTENVSVSRNRVLGDIINNSAHSLDRGATVTVVFRDANGYMLAASSTTVRDVAANGSTPFNLLIWSPLASEITMDNFEVFVSARY